MTHMLCGGGPPSYLVPLLLIGLPKSPLTLRTVRLTPGVSNHPRTSDSAPSLGRNTHSSFFKSYACHRSVSTLELVYISFDSFSYLARLLLALRSLQFLSLDCIAIGKLDHYPASIAKQKCFRIHSLCCKGLGEQALLHFARWIVQSDALFSMEKLSLNVHLSKSDALRVRGAGSCISAMLRSAGNSLKHLELDMYSQNRDYSISDIAGRFICCAT